MLVKLRPRRLFHTGPFTGVCRVVIPTQRNVAETRRVFIVSCDRFCPHVCVTIYLRLPFVYSGPGAYPLSSALGSDPVVSVRASHNRCGHVVLS